jgi:chemotaxis protein methyltransferase CheR
MKDPVSPCAASADHDLGRGYTIAPREYDMLRALIRKETGISLDENKRAMLCSRLARRLRQLNLASYMDYYRTIAAEGANGSELQELINCITTNKTNFFRESHHFDYLRDNILPQVVEGAKRGRPRHLRIWSAGCSTGEEPYSIALTLLEHLPSLQDWHVSILASDVDTGVLVQAEKGHYAIEKVRYISADLLHRYFLKGTGIHAGLVSVRPVLRRYITFRRLNLVQPWPLRHLFDLIFCRNVLIYFDRATQRKLISRFADQLAPEGYLFLGHSENLYGVSDTFVQVGRTIHQARPVHSTPPRKTTIPERTLIVGDVFASNYPAVLKTFLGSCVSACLYDPETGVGGMNHFSLPTGSADEGTCSRYGVYAMELLINEIMQRGGDRRRLQAKVFGGAHLLNVPAHAPSVGQRNAQFVLAFLQTEKIPVVARCLGGTSGLRVHFFPHQGKTFVKLIDGRQLANVAIEENRYSRDILREFERPRADNVTLF